MESMECRLIWACPLVVPTLIEELEPEDEYSMQFHQLRRVQPSCLMMLLATSRPESRRPVEGVVRPISKRSSH